LHYAAWYEREDMVAALLAENADLKAQDKDGRTSLHLAAFRGQTKVLEVLFKALEETKEADVIDIQDNDGWTALYLASRVVGTDKSVQLLVAANANVEVKDGDGRTVLHWAALDGHAQVVKMLLAHAKIADVLESQDCYGGTALHLAVEEHDLDVIRLLLATGMDIERKDKHGRTALHLAAVHGSVKLETGVVSSKSMFTPRLLSPLDLATGIYADAVKMLLNAKSNPNSTDNEGRTILSNAAECGNVEIVKALLEAGAADTEEAGQAALSHAKRRKEELQPPTPKPVQKSIGSDGSI
jgi:ankyrin repeat protein